MNFRLFLQYKKIISTICGALFFALFHSLFYTGFPGSRGLSGLIEQYEMKFLDAWFELRGPKAIPPEIVIIAMDEDSYNFLNVPLNKPFPRRLHAELLEKLAKYRARRAVFDILFLGESEKAVDDEALAEAISHLPVVLGADFGVSDDSHGKKHYQLRPLEIFQKNAEYLGIVGFREDYGAVRRFMVEMPEYNEDLRPLSERAVGIPENTPSNRDLINFYGPPGSIKTIPLYQVMDEDLPPQTIDLMRRNLEGKIVFIGLAMKTGLGAEFKDSYLTSASNSVRMFGVEIHASAAGNLLDGSWIRRSSAASEIIALGLAAFLLSFVVLAAKPLVGAAVCLVALLSWAVFAYYYFSVGIFVPGAFLLTILLPLIYLTSTLYSYIQTKITQLRFRRAFELYLSPEMAERLAKNRETLKLGGEKVFATAIFTDIAGFTATSESLSAEEVASMLNSYFTQVMDVIFQNDGTLIKFIGDAVFALWGAPIKIEDHARRACLSAIEIRREVAAFNASSNFPALPTRIGIHSGPMVVGNLGSAKRFDFTAIGDAVNLAARVEGLNKYFGTTILITESVKEAAGEDLQAVFMGKIAVAGKKQAVNLYTLLENSEGQEELENWDTALRHFVAGSLQEAREVFSSIYKSGGFFAKAAEFYLLQIEQLPLGALPGGWNGELAFSKK